MNFITPWIKSAKADGVFILLPPFLCLILIVAFPGFFLEYNETDLFSWIVLVLLIDVAHVYSTLFITYFDVESRKKRQSLFILVPLLCWFLSVFLYFISPSLFWSAIAYLAVWHFIRQQYGFFRIYTRNEVRSNFENVVNNLAIYSATLGPILYWHFSADRKFYWFLKGDFLLYPNNFLRDMVLAILLIIQAIYLVKELVRLRTGKFNVPANLLWLGTLLSWSIGIIVLNGDLTFTLTNVVAHGVPYLALVYFSSPLGRRKTGVSGVIRVCIYFLAPLFAFAFIEEFFWDGFIWQDEEHEKLFGSINFLPKVQGADLKALIIPILAVPQLTHYVLDGFIWKGKKES